MKKYSLYVKVNDYTNGVWFKVIDYMPSYRLLEIVNHQLGGTQYLRIDDRMELKVMEVSE